VAAAKKRYTKRKIGKKVTEEKETKKKLLKTKKNADEKSKTVKELLKIKKNESLTAIFSNKIDYVDNVLKKELTVETN